MTRLRSACHEGGAIIIQFMLTSKQAELEEGLKMYVRQQTVFIETPGETMHMAVVVRHAGSERVNGTDSYIWKPTCL